MKEREQNEIDNLKKSLISYKRQIYEIDGFIRYEFGRFNGQYYVDIYKQKRKMIVYQYIGLIEEYNRKVKKYNDKYKENLELYKDIIFISY